MLILHPYAPITSSLRFTTSQCLHSNSLAFSPPAKLSLRVLSRRKFTTLAGLAESVDAELVSPELMEPDDIEEEQYEEEQYEEGDGFSARGGVYSGREGEKEYDKDPELAEILGGCLDDPQKAQARVSFSSILSILIGFCVLYEFRWFCLFLISLLHLLCKQEMR